MIESSNKNKLKIMHKKKQVKKNLKEDIKLYRIIKM